MKLNCGQELIQKFPYVALYFGNVYGDHGVVNAETVNKEKDDYQINLNN